MDKLIFEFLVTLIVDLDLVHVKYKITDQNLLRSYFKYKNIILYFVNRKLN